ncbi:hypothetical protein [Streptomyces albidoflavus]|uniref:hypothetical protein n=1 Tax=Streptomyces albidoflavus TaxID=1886 RepID=UPI003D0A950A
MSAFDDAARQWRLRDALPAATRVDLGPSSVDQVCRLYEEAGHDVEGELREFFEEYREVSISWIYREMEVSVQIVAEEALSFPEMLTYSLGRWGAL